MIDNEKQTGVNSKQEETSKKINNEAQINLRTLTLSLSFFLKDELFENQNLKYEVLYLYSKGIVEIWEIDTFSNEKTLVRRFRDRRGRGITQTEMLENIEEISQMNYKEFKEKLLMPSKIERQLQTQKEVNLEKQEETSKAEQEETLDEDEQAEEQAELLGENKQEVAEAKEPVKRGRGRPPKVKS